MASYLLKPFKTLGGLELKNRIVLAPLTRGRAGLERMPNAVMGTYYTQRSGAGLLITEATAISEQGYGWYSAPGIYKEEHAAAWKTHITDSVHASGSFIFCQLWHMGRQSHSSYHGGELPVAPSAIAVGQGQTTGQDGKKYDYEVPRALETAELPGVVESYRRAAELAKAAGFDGVEVHAANGYLIDQFLQSVSNKRTDQYGGSFENRYRLLDEVVTAVKTVYPSDRIGVRLSPQGVFGGMGSEDNWELFTFVADKLREHSLAYLHLMDGLGFGYHGKCPVVTPFDIKSRFQGPIIGNIGYTRDTADGAIRSGAVDLVAFGRPFISNPDLPERFANNSPLAPDADYGAYYHGGEKGYIDWPVYQDGEQAK